MQTPDIIERPTDPSTRRRSWIPAAVAAAVVIAAIIGSALLLRNDASEPLPPATVPTTVEPGPDARSALALEKTTAFYESLASGDVEAVIGLTAASEAERAMWQYNIVWQAAHPSRFGTCEIAAEQTLLVVVHCPVTSTDPVFEAAGIADLVAPWWVYDDGRLQWRTFIGGDVGKANRAYRDYLMVHRPSEYDAVCSPAAYPAGSVVDASGLALTPECAELTTASAGDVAAWLEDGGAAASATDMVTMVEALVEVHNSGDFEAWRGLLIDRPDVFGGVRSTEADWDFQRSFFAANEEWTIRGECRPVDSTSVACPLTLVNDFMAPAGIWFTVPALRVSFTVDGDISGIGAETWEVAGDPEDYFAAFDAWLADIHPEVHAGFGPRVAGWGRLPSAADMPSALQYVEEFLAQSDVYPLR